MKRVMLFPVALLLLAACGANKGDAGAGTDANCEALSCAELGFVCGAHEDNCGNEVDCGPCDCKSETCESLGVPCGIHPDGCGADLDCGDCGACSDYPLCPELALEPNRQCGPVSSACDPSYSPTCSNLCTLDWLGPLGIAVPDGVAGTCVSDLCVFSPDSYEPNEDAASARDLGEYNDDEINCLLRFANLDVDTDEDWFKLYVHDRFSLANPNLYISPGDSEPGGDIELSVWFVCDSGGDASTCLSYNGHTNDNTLGAGCTTDDQVYLSAECDGTDDSGWFYIRVRRKPTAIWNQPYMLQMRIADGGPGVCNCDDSSTKCDPYY